MYELCSSDFVIYYDTELAEPHSDKSGLDMMSDVYVSKWKRHKLSSLTNLRKRDRKYKIFKLTNEGNPNYVKTYKSPNGKSNTQAEVPEASAEKLIHFHNYEVDNEADERNSSRVIFERSSRFFRRSQIMSRFSNMVQNRKNYYRTKFKNLLVDAYEEPYCLRCEKRRIRKMNKLRFNYPLRSHTDGKNRLPVTVGVTNGMRSPLYYNEKSIRYRFPKASLSSLSSLDSEIENYPRLYKYNRRVQNCILKQEAHAKRFFKDKKLQCPSKSERNQVIATPYWEESNSKQSENNLSGCSVLPSSSSGFWEYLIDKIIKKQTGNECDIITNCPCGQSEVCLKAQESTRRTEQRVHECVEKVHDIGSASKECNLTKANNDGNKSDTSHKVCPCDCKKKRKSCKDAHTIPPNVTADKPCNKSNKEEFKETETNEVDKKDCKNIDIENKPCRSPHDEVAKKLEKKYNGEILCIHNPPCILINGCLNLPSVTTKPATACWPMTQVKKPSMYNLYKRAKERVWSERHKACEPAKLHESSSNSSSRYRLPSLNRNKMNQTFCQKPFCNLVKLCCKPKYGICPQIPHTHVPTFRKPPKYMEQPKHRDQVPKTKYLQAIKSHKKFSNGKNKTSIPLQSNTVLLTSSVEKALLRPSSVPVYHKNRLLRMIQVKR